MAQIGRNDPCPCGSGKKYKKCCLAKEEAAASRIRGEQSAVQTALEWLQTNYPEEVSEAVYVGFMGELEEEELETLEALPPEIGHSVILNSGEWLLTDAVLSINGRDQRALDLVLGNKGPRLSDSGREWLGEIAKRSMSLYEVREVKKAEGLLLKDLVHPDEAPVWVREKSATEFVLQWDIFGARLACKEGEMVLTGAVYPMERAQAHTCLEEIRSEIAGEEDDKALVRQLVGYTIIQNWLDGFLEEKPLPKFVDASSGDKIDLTTDHYRVLNWGRLEEILARQDDVEGDRNEGWTRFVDVDDTRRRSLASLTSVKGDILEVFCRTLPLADKSRVWLEQLAGDAIAFKIREVTDPRSSKAHESAGPAAISDIPQDVQRQIIHEYLLKHYETWPETPLPALGGKTPLQAVKSKKRRQEVIELLKSIDQLEQRRTAETGGEPLDVRFLWDRLGIEREKS